MKGIMHVLDNSFTAFRHALYECGKLPRFETYPHLLQTLKHFLFTARIAHLTIVDDNLN